MSTPRATAGSRRAKTHLRALRPSALGSSLSPSRRRCPRGPTRSSALRTTRRADRTPPQGDARRIPRRAVQHRSTSFRTRRYRNRRRTALLAVKTAYRHRHRSLVRSGRLFFHLLKERLSRRRFLVVVDSFFFSRALETRRKRRYERRPERSRACRERGSPAGRGRRARRTRGRARRRSARSVASPRAWSPRERTDTPRRDRGPETPSSSFGRPASSVSRGVTPRFFFANRAVSRRTSFVPSPSPARVSAPTRVRGASRARVGSERAWRGATASWRAGRARRWSSSRKRRGMCASRA